MNNFASRMGTGVAVSAAAVSVAWVVCSMLIPHGFSWMGPGWAGLALLGTLSLAQALRGSETQPVVAVAIPPEVPVALI